MDNITKVTVESRRSHPIGKDFFTFTMSLEAEVKNMTEDAKKAYIEKMWNYANSEVDNQIAEVQGSLDKK